MIKTVLEISQNQDGYLRVNCKQQPHPITMYVM